MDLLKHLEVPMHKVPVLFAKARAEMRKEISTVKLFEGMHGCLEKLKAAGVRMGIVTSNSQENVRECLENNRVLSQFEFVHSATNLFGKHRTLRGLLKKQKLNADDVLYVGDEARDIEASKRCHIKVVAVGWGFQSFRQLRSMEPDHVAEKPSDIVKFVFEKFSR